MVSYPLSRRFVLGALLGAAASGTRAFAASPTGPESPFSFAWLEDKARRSASMPFRPAPVQNPAVLDRLDYDAHWKIRFRDEVAPLVGGMPLEFFHVGKYAREPVRIFMIGNGMQREVHYSEDFFTMPASSPAHELGEDAGFAGLRLMRPGGKPDWISFLGAAYFRCDGPDAQYGMSARGIAIDVGTMKTEEFPRFASFWVGEAERPDEDAVIYAELDGPSVTGAYRIGAKRSETVQYCNIEARLFFRTGVERLGIAPLTSMFWYSELNRAEGIDWRPEIHDSDGLAVFTGSGERLWRPLRNPSRVTVASFVDENPRGFGLAQRDRSFENYQDDGVFYNRRPSTWVAPMGNWGRGAVQLLEIPTADETFDNIVAYWTPERQPAAGDALSYDYRLEWRERDPEPGEVGRTVATWRGAGGIPGHLRPVGIHKYVIDFAGGKLATPQNGVELSVVASGGTLSQQSVRPVVSTDRWRAIFDLEVDPKQPVELRVYLHKGGEPLTETWTLLAEG